MSPFEKWILAHMIGDYFLQNNWMALHKSKKSPEFNPNALYAHSAIYGLVFAIIFMNFYVGLIAAVLHGLFDYFPATNWWLNLIGSRSFESHFKQESDMKMTAIYGGFTAIVYCGADFVIHFITTYPLIIKLL